MFCVCVFVCICTTPVAAKNEPLELEIEFEGALQTGALNGLYLSRYVSDDDG